MGVHTNICILNRSFGIRQFTRLGFQVVLVRDLTDAMYDPRQRPFVSHTRGTELVIEHIEAGRPLIDTRNAESFASGTIPTARSIPLAELDERIDEVDRDVKTVLFCNGPACAATPQAIHKLLAAGHPASQLRYYRGGMHDWLTLGLPTSAGTP